MPHSTLDAAERARLSALVESMPPLPRRVFERHRVGNAPLDQIAAELQLDQRTVERLLAQAMLHLDADEP